MDELKIDQSFIRDMEEGETERSIVSAIVTLAKSLNLKVVGEGVETQDQLEVLQNSACDQYQGFLFSKPVLSDHYVVLECS